jgi:hypothetical protein
MTAEIELLQWMFCFDRGRQGFPHGMPTTEADTINADLLAFIQS